jgi:hypothetical protein
MGKRIISQAYLLGIQDERALLRDLQSRGEYDAHLDAPAMLAAERTLARGFAGAMAEYMRGSRDFWRNQVNLLKAG